MPTSTTTALTLRDAVTLAGSEGTVSVSGVEFTVTAIRDDRVGLSLPFNPVIDHMFSDNDRPEWSVVTRIADVTLDDSPEAVAAAVGVGGVMFNHGNGPNAASRPCFYEVVTPDSARPINSTIRPDSHAFTTPLSNLVRGGWAAAGEPFPQPFAVGDTVTFFPATSYERNTGTVDSVHRNSRFEGVGEYWYGINVPATDESALYIIRGDGRGETVTAAAPSLPVSGLDRDAALAMLDGKGGTLRYLDSDAVWTVTPDRRCWTSNFPNDIHGDARLTLSGVEGVWTVLTIGAAAPTGEPVTTVPAPYTAADVVVGDRLTFHHETAGSGPLCLGSSHVAVGYVATVTRVDPTRDALRIEWEASGTTDHRIFEKGHVMTRAGAPTPVAEPEPAKLLPRTSGDAHALLETLRTFGEPSQETITALRTLRTFLPGGKAEAAGSEHQRAADLCGQYENIVTPVLGWTPRPSLIGNSGYDKRDEFAREVDAFEDRNASSPAAVLLQLFAERYARGGVVNTALVDHIESHLESYKIPGANELLDALGMDPAPEEPEEQEYDVYVDVERSITVTQRVLIRVMATDSDAAEENVDRSSVYDAIDDSEWTVVESGDTVTLSTSSYDVDDWSVDFAELSN